jgi:V/A-type H+-transporting ATPase subunit K
MICKARLAIAVLALTSVLLVMSAGGLAQGVATITDISTDAMNPGKEFEFAGEVNESLGITTLWVEYTMVADDGYSESQNVSMTADGANFTYTVTVWDNATWLNYTISGSDSTGIWYAVHQSLEPEEEGITGVYLAAIGAGLAVGIAGMGAGIGVGIAGAAGAGVVAEKPDKFGTAIVFQALPQTQAIYGLLIAILILLGTGLLGGEAKVVPVSVGLVAIGCGLAVGIAGLSAIGQGIAASAGVGAASEKADVFGKGIVFSVLPETQAIYGLLVAILLMNFTGLIGGDMSAMASAAGGGIPIGLIAIACGLAIGIAGLSAIGQGISAAGGMGVTAEKPEMFGKGIVFSVLPETQAIYGLLVAILLMAFSGMFAKDFAVTLNQSIASIGAGLAIGIAGLSAIGQGITGSAAVAATARNPESMGKGLIFSVMSETFAIFGLLIAILIMRYTGLM